MKGSISKILAALGLVLGLILLFVLAYVIYMQLTYYRIPDNTPQSLENPADAVLKRETVYTALSYNIGFGAYDQEFSFFMDEGIMQDGTRVKGKNARARSLEAAEKNTRGARDIALAEKADFYLFQEVDRGSTRSFGIDQREILEASAPGAMSTYASNFHSAYLFYPFSEPHGKVNSGLLTLSAYDVSEAVRRSFPVDESFLAKFFDLDRCFSVLRLPVEGGGELTLIHVHLSAYDEGGLVREKQLKMLSGVMAEEAEKGNHVIVGGDFNHALCGTVSSFPSRQLVPDWVAVLDESELAPGFRVVCADNVTEVPSCRGSDLPYEKGMNYSVVIDGFIVSDKVTASAENLDTDFLYSDHNPVRLRFALN